MKLGTALIALLVLIAVPAAAQDVETIFGENDIDHGGFGGPVLKAGQINGTTGVFFGGRGGWIVAHRFIIGGGGYGLVSAIDALVPHATGDRRLNFGYGGLELEYVHHYDRLMHWSVLVLVGAGGVGYRRSDVMGGGDLGSADEVFVVEPAIQAHLNITKFFRISAGASYRYVSGVTTPATTNEKLGGANGVLTLRFGKF
ncbi:MAG: hypothetical protein MUE68_12170 [Bacteroidetes bacterium]|jgi:hypothetical protein|nr:hypothetical protein [Bacteroidota bacterium]